jgi:molecular chaperone GrpE (heat shock protein)
MGDSRTGMAEIVENLKEKIVKADTLEEINEEFVSSIDELIRLELETYRSEDAEYLGWRRERTKWVRRYRKLFRAIPSLLVEIKKIVSSLVEDDSFEECPGEVKDRLRNRKEGLEIINRMLERILQYQSRLDKILIRRPRQVKMLNLSPEEYIQAWDLLKEPKQALVKIEEIIEKIEQRDKDIRDDNYRLNWELKQEVEKLTQAVLSFLKDHLLPVIDGLERGIWDENMLRQPLNTYPEPKELINKWFGAYHLCYDSIKDFFRMNGLREIELRRGDEFDPECHMALGYESCEGLEDGQIIELLRSGWNYYGLQVRSAEVMVAKNEGGGKDVQKGQEG